MNAEKCMELAIYVITEYYKNNTEALFSAYADNVMWYGPCMGQELFGIDSIRSAWAQENNSLTFSIDDLHVRYISTSPSSCETMAELLVTTHYPNSEDVPIFQRVHLSWGDQRITDADGKRKRVPKIYTIHISNPMEQHNLDVIYPIHYNKIFRYHLPPYQEMRINLKGTDSSLYQIRPSSVLWASTVSKGHSKVHLVNKTISVRYSISDIAKQAGNSLLKIHSSYIVNPYAVESIKRCSVTMSDGAVIPIPEKKYTAVKKALQEAVQQQS